MILIGSTLYHARRELCLFRSRIDERWDELEGDLQARANLASELLELVDRTRPGVADKDFLAARNSLAGSLQQLRRATDRGAQVEGNLSVERALRLFTENLSAERRELADRRAAPGLGGVSDEMLAVEHRIALHRTAYNEAVQHFNTRLALFPANLAALVFGIQRYPHYVPTDIHDLMQMPPAPLEPPKKEGEIGR